MAGKTWKSVHEVCINQLSGAIVSAEKLLHWAEVYADGAKVPIEAIPKLVQTFQAANADLNNRDDFWEVNSTVELAVASLRVQLEEGEQEKRKT